MKVELADGTLFDGTVAYVNPYLSIKIPAKDAQVHFFDFNNKEKIGVIKFHVGPYMNVYHGFDTFASMEFDVHDPSVVRITFLGSEDSYVEHNVLGNAAEYYGVPAEYLPEELRGETNQNGSNNGQSD